MCDDNLEFFLFIYIEYDRCHNPLGMENFAIGNDQISASSEKSATTPAASGRRNAVKAHGLDGAWCAATNDQVHALQ